MTPLSLAAVDDEMTLVDVKALASADLKSSIVKTPEHEDEPALDNQTEDADEDAMDTTTATPVDADAAAEVNNKKERRVAFATADVVEFEPTVWTATVSSDGVPVGISSIVRRRTRRRLDSLESERMLYRVNRQEYMEHGYLEPEERVDILEAAGHSIAIISHVEREAVRVNRERWESNEYDLLYQFGLGETAIMDLDEEDELLLSQGTIMGFHNQEPEDEEEDDEMLEPEDEDEGNPAEYYYYSNRAATQTDAEVRFAMEEIDAYDTRKYEEWAWDYTTDCVLGDDDDDQYSKDSNFDLPSLDFGLPEMSSSPTDISSSSDCMIVSCGKVIGAGSSSPSSKVSSPRLFV